MPTPKSSSCAPASSSAAGPQLGALSDGLVALRLALSELGESHLSVMPTQLEGGASTRQFFRIRFRGDEAIAMYTPAPSQEIVKARQAAGYSSFIEVAGLLRAHGIRVPEILATSSCSPIVVMEDLGDFTLAQYLDAHPDSKELLYRKAVRTLARAQAELSPLPDDSIIASRSFDFDLLRWELEHFREWGLEARGIQLTGQDASVFSQAADYLAHAIADWPKGFVHRDYQSRNIMVRGDRGAESLTWIDFQDAMLGPRVYDLVALLTDSYQVFTPEFIERRLDEYCEERDCLDDRKKLSDEFLLVTVQRKLKDAGRFIFLERVNKNPSFLRFVEPTIAKARSALRQVHSHPPLAELDKLLTRLFGPLALQPAESAKLPG